MTRQQEIRQAIKLQYQQGAVAELSVALLRNEMTALPHRHDYGFRHPRQRIETCMYCNQWRVIPRNSKFIDEWTAWRNANMPGGE